MKCPVCGRDNGAGVSFCEGCGRKIPRCPTCGLELTCRDRFCSNDGTRLSDDLLLLVPEESILQEPVWSKPAAPAAPAWDVPAFSDFDEGTVKAEPKASQPASDAWSEPFGEETVRVAPISGSRGWKRTPPVRNSDPVNVSDWDRVIPDPKPPQRAFCEDCGKRVAVGNRFCPDCQRARESRDTGSSRKNVFKVIAIILLVILLVIGLFAGGYAIVNSELFDWDTSSSNREEKEKDDEDEDKDEDEDTTDDAGENIPEENPADSSEGVVDPVAPQPGTENTTPVETIEPTTEATEPPTEAVSNPLVYWMDNCDKMYLTEEDLEGFDKQMCIYARNAIYAKSGRMFNSTELQNYFAQFDWYTPVVSPDRFTGSMLNSYQNANLNLILEYEREHGYS